MKKHEAYDAILDLVLDKVNTTGKNVKHDLPAFAEDDPSWINLMSEDISRIR